MLTPDQEQRCHPQSIVQAIKDLHGALAPRFAS
jgi:hypothetical protein